MVKRNKTALFGLLLTAVLCSCGHQRVLIKQQSDTPHPRAVANYVEGVFYELNENPAAALLSYQEALLYDSTAADLHLAIGRSYLALGRVEAGIMALKKALKVNPGETVALQTLAEVYLQQTNLKEAENVFQQMLANDSLDLDACLGIGMIAQQTGDNEKAKKYYRKCLALDSQFDSRIYDFLGMLYLQEGAFDDGEKVYQESLAAFPGNGIAFNRLGMISEARGDTVTAISQYEKAVALAPGFKEPVGRLNLIYMARNSWDKSIQLFEGQIGRDSTDIESWLGLGTSYATSGDVENAKEIFSEMIIRFPKDGRASVNLGEMYMDEEEWLKAYEAFKPVTVNFPDSPEGWLRCGRALLFADSLDLAEHYFKQTLDKNKDDFLANYFLGSLLVQQSRNLDAVPYLEKSLESVSDPGRRFPILGSLASAYDAIGRYEVADSLFRQSLAIEPRNSTILNNYGYSLAGRGERLDEALEMALQALEQEPDNGSFLDTVGWIYFLKAEYVQAENYLSKSWSVRNTSAEVADHLGDAYEKLGKMEKARSLWQEALKLEPENKAIRLKLDTLNNNK